MNYEQIETLSRIYNTFLMISTKGEDTMLMAECMKAFKQFILNEQQKLQEQSTQEG